MARQMTYHHFPEDATFADLFRAKVSTAGHGSRAVACFLFARSEAVTVGSNPTQGMDV
jgi:hypothetical protein